LNGNEVKDEIGERSAATPRSASWAGYGAFRSTYGPTKNQMDVIRDAHAQLPDIKSQISDLDTNLLTIAKALKSAGAPWIEGFDD